ncbi:MAG: DUF4349 domain-containing protein [Niabella sp.]|nr:DUF4349 domain-containing protein [Niabella sp.]
MIRRFLVMFALPLVLFACNNGNKHEEKSAADEQKMEVAAIAVGDSTTEQAPLVSPGAATAPADIDKKIIKNAEVKIETSNLTTYAQKIRSLTKKYGAYIAKEENTETDEKLEAQLLIKVPVLYFEDLLNELSGTDAKQLERSITSEEVSGQIVDTKARLLTKKQTRDKYLEFLKQAKTTEDALKIQREMNDLQEEIESAESRLGYLSNQTRYSTVNLSVIAPKSGYSYSEKPGFGRKVVGALQRGASWFADLFVGLLSLWPLWAGAIGMGILIKRMQGHRKPKNG